jgi:cell division protein FtsZ
VRVGGAVKTKRKKDNKSRKEKEFSFDEDFCTDDTNQSKSLFDNDEKRPFVETRTESVEESSISFQPVTEPEPKEEIIVQQERMRQRKPQTMRKDTASKERKGQLRMPHKASIKVIGIGGAGGNAINRMIESGLEGVEFIAINTDLQALEMTLADSKIQIGTKSTKGLGAGGDPDVGLKAAMESKAELGEVLDGADMVFITAGMGGGTGTGAAPVIAELSKERGSLTIGVVTKPFTFEGFKRRQVAEQGVDALRDSLDALITIPNDKLLEVIKEDTTLIESFKMADDILRQGVQGISDLIIKPGLINLDFADVKAIMLNAGTALIGIGQASGPNRAVEAARKAITSPLLETSIEGAKGILINITGSDLKLSEVNQAAEEIYEVSDKESNIIFGTALDSTLKDEIRITVLATGFRNVKEEPQIPIKAGLHKGQQKDQSMGLSDAENQLLGMENEDLDIPTFLRRGNYQA